MSGIGDVLVDVYGGLGWKVHEKEWKDLLIPVETLERQRRIGDPDADSLLEELKLGFGDDVVATIEALSSGEGKGRQAAADFWSQVQHVPEWVDWDTIERGQEVFWRFAGPKLMLLLHFSLLVGVSAPKVNRVLLSTGYLTRSGERTFKRLLETTSWLVAVMESGSMRPLESGWKACLRVRFLHAHVRQRLRALAERDPSAYDESVYGVPINQEDSAATILAFSVGPIAGLQRLGITLTEKQQDDYCHLWRYIGWLLGVQEDVNPCRSFPHAAAAAVSIVRHISDPDESSKTIAHALLESCAEAAFKREPKYSVDAWRGFLDELTRIVVGDEYAAAIGLPVVTDAWTRWSAWALTFYYRVSAVYLSEISRFREWRVQRAKHFIPKMLTEMLGGMPKFLLKHEPTKENLTGKHE